MSGKEDDLCVRIVVDLVAAFREQQWKRIKIQREMMARKKTKVRKICSKMRHLDALGMEVATSTDGGCLGRVWGRSRTSFDLAGHL